MRPFEIARRFPLSTFLALAFALTWSLLPAARASVAVSFLALWGPAVAALATAALRGPQDLRVLGDRIALWRAPARWYLLALLAPLPISALASGLAVLAGAPGPIHLQPVSGLQAVVFLLVAGEEIGWRGFALPFLLSRVGPWRASIFLGTVWALWHLPLFYLPEMPQFGSPFLPFVAYTIGLSVILTVLAQKTKGSVVIATLFHGAVNTFGFINAAATPAQKGWANALSYGVVAAMAGAAVWTERARRHPTADGS
jgi:membrane protease YdiL (CAAX protease family)